MHGNPAGPLAVFDNLAATRGLIGSAKLMLGSAPVFVAFGRLGLSLVETLMMNGSEFRTYSKSENAFMGAPQ